MSTEKTELKTIRIDAASYYKLNELSGLWTFIFGSQIPISRVASWAISTYYLPEYKALTELINDPEELQKFRTRLKETGYDFVGVTK